MTFQFTTKRHALRRNTQRAKRVALDPRKAEQYAIELVRDHKISALADRVLDLLAVAGVLSERQIKTVIPVSYRSLLRYYKLHLVDRVPPHVARLERFGFARTDTIYTLGMVGLELAQIRAERGLVPTNYLGYGIHQVAHDLLTNAVVIALSQRALNEGLRTVWRSRYEATVHEGEQPLLEPDAFLELEGCGRPLVIEYHNEPSAQRALEKVQRYERVQRGGRWQASWRTQTFPLVLVAFTHKAVAAGYQAALEEVAGTMGLRCRYLGRSWESVRSGYDPALWQDFRTGKVVNVLTGEEVR